MFDITVAVDPAGHDVADEGIATKLRRKIGGGIKHDPRDGGRSVCVITNIWRETEAIMGLAEARIIRAAQQLVDWRTMTIGRPQITERIKHQAEGIDLPPGELLDVRAVRPEAIGVPGVQVDPAAVLGDQGGVIVVAVIGVDPAVVATAEGAG